MPQLILNQLRWLDHIVKGKVCHGSTVTLFRSTYDIVRSYSFCSQSQDLCSQLLEVVSVAPLVVQREIITSLPEILEDAQHNDTAKELK